MKTRDGVEFYLGMTLFTSGGHAKPTDPETHEVREIEHDGKRCPCIARKGGSMEIAIKYLYSSNVARLRDQIASLEGDQEEIQDRIDALEIELEEAGD